PMEPVLVPPPVLPENGAMLRGRAALVGGLPPRAPSSTRSGRRGAGAGVGLAAALAVHPQLVWASSVDVRCPDLAVTEVGELQARARLLLSSAGYETAKVGVECDASGTW